MGRSYAPNPVFQFFGDDGKPLVFGFLCTYIAGTNTPVATYDSDGKPNEVKMRLNGRGETDTAIMLDADMAYKFVLLRPDGSEIWTRDNVAASGSSGTAGTDISAEHPITKKMVGSTALIGFDSTDIDNAISDETKAREESEKSINDSLAVIGDALSTETDERKSEDKRLESLIGEKQGTLSDGDNIHIDGEKKVNVVNRKTLQVKSPLTAEKLDSALVLGIRDGAFATADDIASEAEARKAADDTLESSMAGKQDGPFTFDSSSSTNSDVMAAITAGRTIVSWSGSSFSTWQGSIAGGVANLFRVFGTDVFHYYYSFGQWAFQRYSLATTMDYSKVAYPTSTQVPGDILFAMGGFNVCGYTDNAGALRLCVVPTDGKDHSIYANGGGYRCDAETGANVSTSFTAGSPYLRLYLVDTGYWDSDTSTLTPTNWTVHEAEIYAITGTSVANSSILYRVITDQTIGGANG